MHSLIHPLLFAYSCIYVHHFFIDSLMWQPRTSSFMKAKVWECIDLMKLSSPWWLSQVDLWPEDVVDPDDVLLVGVLGVDGDGGTGLDPDVTAVLLDPPVVLSDTLTLIHHWERDIEIYKEREREEVCSVTVDFVWYLAVPRCWTSRWPSSLFITWERKEEKWTKEGRVGQRAREKVGEREREAVIRCHVTAGWELLCCCRH